MNKKIIYGILFVSLFLLSTVSMVQPARGYSFGVPSEGKGTTSEGEIKLYDEDDWEDHLGSDSGADDPFDGDADVVGAKSKQTIIKLEKDEEIRYVGKYIFAGTIDAGSLLTVSTVKSLYDPDVTGAYGPLMYLFNSSAWLGFDPVTLALIAETYKLTGVGNFSVMMELATGISASVLTPVVGFAANTPTPSQLAPGAGTKYDGSILTRDYWETTEDAYDANPDDEDYEVPFLADPRDWVSAWETTNNFKNLQKAELLTLQGIWGSNWHSAGGANPTGTMFAHSVAVPGTMNASDVEVYEYLNTTIIPGVLALAVGAGSMTAAQAATLEASIAVPNNMTATMESYYLSGMTTNPGDYQIDRVYGLWGASMLILAGASDALEFGYPSKPGFLLQMLVGGQPVYVPQGDFVEKIVDEFDIDDDVLYKVPYVSQEYVDPITKFPVYKPVEAYWDISADNGVVTVGIEYLDAQVDPSETQKLIYPADPDELKDFEMVFVYGEYGGQDSVTFKDGDTEFWKSGGIDQIPGFEISIILGASALSIIGLIFVVMKKRKR